MRSPETQGSHREKPYVGVARRAALQLLPFVGPGWYPKVSIAAKLETGVRRWNHIPLGIYACGHVGAATWSAWTLRGPRARSTAKLSVNASAASWTAPGADFTQSFCYGEGSVWNFVYTRRLLTNGTYRPIHDAVLGFEHCMVAKARRLPAAPPRCEAGQDGLPTAPGAAKEPAREPGGADQAAAPGRHTRLSGGGV